MRLNQGSIGTVSVSTITDSLTRLLGVVRGAREYAARNSKAYIGYVNAAGVAAQNGHIQILNPAASGKTVLVTSLRATAVGASIIQLTDYSVALGTAVTTLANKNIGGAANVGLLKTTTNAGVLGNVLAGLRVLASSPVQLLNDGPLILDAGEGLTIVDVTVNETMTATIEWEEE